MSSPELDDRARVDSLLDAQTKAERLFDEVERRGMIRAGIGERALSDDIRDLAAEMFGVTRHWHKRIVRAGENTLETFRANPPDRIIADDDILFGPINNPNQLAHVSGLVDRVADHARVVAGGRRVGERGGCEVDVGAEARLRPGAGAGEDETDADVVVAGGYW